MPGRKPEVNAATRRYRTGETKGTAGYDNGPAPAVARNRGKAALAVGKPPYGGPKGKGTLASPRPPGPPAKKAPITGPMQGLRGRKPTG